MEDRREYCEHLLEQIPTPLVFLIIFDLDLTFNAQDLIEKVHHIKQPGILRTLFV